MSATYEMPWGKYSGLTLEEILEEPGGRSHLEWVYDNIEDNEEIRNNIENFLSL